MPACPESASRADAKRKTGFALLDREARQRIAKAGARASAKSAKARRWTAQMARQMAPRGGYAVQEKRRAARENGQ